MSKTEVGIWSKHIDQDHVAKSAVEKRFGITQRGNSGKESFTGFLKRQGLVCVLMEDRAVAVVKLGAKLSPDGVLEVGCPVEKIDALVDGCIHIGGPEDSEESADKFAFARHASKGEIEMTRIV